MLDALEHFGQQVQKGGILDDIVSAPEFHHVHRHALIALPGGNDKRRQRPSGKLEHLYKRFAVHIGQPVIKYQQVRGVGCQVGQRRAGRADADRDMPVLREFFLQQFRDAGVIFNQ